MPFETGKSAEYVIDKIGNWWITKSITGNPFYTALFIAIIIMLVILFVFRDVDFSEEEESLGVLTIRSGVYLLILITGIMFLQNRALLGEFKSGSNEAKLDDIFDTEKTKNERLSGLMKESVSYDKAFIPTGVDKSFVH